MGAKRWRRRAQEETSGSERDADEPTSLLSGATSAWTESFIEDKKIAEAEGPPPPILWYRRSSPCPPPSVKCRLPISPEWVFDASVGTTRDFLCFICNSSAAVSLLPVNTRSDDLVIAQSLSFVSALCKFSQVSDTRSNRYSLPRQLSGLSPWMVQYII